MLKSFIRLNKNYFFQVVSASTFKEQLTKFLGSSDGLYNNNVNNICFI